MSVKQTFQGIELVGINETLRDLKSYDKEQYFKMRARLAKSAQPLATLVGSHYPVQPLKNWHRTGGRKGPAKIPPYNSNARTKVKAVAGTGTNRGRGSTILRIQQGDGAGMIYDSAKNSSMKSFIPNLDKRSRIDSGAKTRSRVLFGVTKGATPMIEGLVAKELVVINNEFNGKLAKHGLGR